MKNFILKLWLKLKKEPIRYMLVPTEAHFEHAKTVDNFTNSGITQDVLLNTPYSGPPEVRTTCKWIIDTRGFVIARLEEEQRKVKDDRVKEIQPKWWTKPENKVRISVLKAVQEINATATKH